MKPLTEAEAREIWAVLVDHAGAVDGTVNGEAFVQFQSTKVCEEYRFGGALGFGGKFRRAREWVGLERRERWYVDCYREDETPARLEVIAVTNAWLAAIKDSADALSEALGEEP